MIHIIFTLIVPSFPVWKDPYLVFLVKKNLKNEGSAMQQEKCTTIQLNPESVYLIGNKLRKTSIFATHGDVTV